MIRPLISRLALFAGLMLLLAACGSATAETSPPTLPSIETEPAAASDATTSTTEPVDPDEALQEHAACMREMGIDMPDPTRDGDSVVIVGEGADSEAFEAAMAECDPILEAAFGEFEMTPEQDAERLDMELAFARCMRENGVEDWKDPSSDGSVVIDIGPDDDTETLEAALATCSTEVFGDEASFSVSEDPAS